MPDEEGNETDTLADIDLEQLALDWASLRRNLTKIEQLSDEERAEFALIVAELFGKDRE